MKIYTKGGDAGTTSLVHAKNISKSDDRVSLVGSADELSSHLGLCKLSLKEGGLP
ncbi:MAG: ATP:cob(I)alamin adenosyltransferase, partial [Blautia sp.]|nr:ATP:cob(I)alamin adenosyltransferase [Blautia sp.]